MEKIRITELANGITQDIDQCDPLGIVRLLRQSDAQLFAGWGSFNALSDAKILHKIDRLAQKVAALLQENESTGTNMLIFSGCGTSGRIAWMCSRSFNRVLCQLNKRPCCSYLIAGGDKALIVGDELPEDDPLRGAADLIGVSDGTDHVILVGITCGLSAPYVAGQIDHAMKEVGKFTPVLLGFNPVEQARDAKIEKWDKTCKQTFLRLAELEEADRGMVLNPVVGPEPITGSSRMKGGSMTAILLDIVFTLALSRAFDLPLSSLLLLPPHTSTCSKHQNECTLAPSSNTLNGTGIEMQRNGTKHLNDKGCCHMLEEGQKDVALLIDAFSATYNAAYRAAPGIASLMEIAHECLRHSNGHLYYMGTQLFGIVGFIDSSEMVSTFGSSPHKYRGFIEGGWKTCQNREGDLSENGSLFCISLLDFEANILPSLQSSDCVIVCSDACAPPAHPDSALNTETARFALTTAKVLQSPAKCCSLAIVSGKESRYPSDKRFASQVVLQIPHHSVADQEPLFGAFALKLILNAISTGTNVLEGKVYHNTMINLTVANDKLFHRSTGIIADICKVAPEEAKVSLLKAIYQENEIGKHLQEPVSHHIKAAAKRSMVVPLAVILASHDCSVEEAASILAEATATTSLRAVVESSSESSAPAIMSMGSAPVKATPRP